VAKYEIKAPTGETFEVTAPDTATEAEVMAYAKTQFQSQAEKPQTAEPVEPPIPESIPISTQLPPPEQVKLPSGEEALRQQSERFNQAALSGMLSLPTQTLQAQTQFERQIPVVQELERAGIKQPTLAESALSAMPQPLAQALAFEPQGKAETAVQLASSFFAPEALAMRPEIPLKAPITAPSPTATLALDLTKKQPSKVIGEVLGSSLQKLEKQRAKLLKAVETAKKLGKSTDELAVKLETNLAKQVETKAAFDNAIIPVADRVNVERRFGVRNTPADIHDKALKTVEFVDTMAEKGVIKKNNVDTIRQAVYNEVLNANGIYPETKKINEFNILGELYRWDNVQKRTGVGTGEIAQRLVNLKTQAANYRIDQRTILGKLYRNAVNSGVAPKELLQDLQYFRTQADGSVLFDPTALSIPGKVAIPESTKRFTMQQEQAMGAIRQYMDSVATDLNLPKLPGYIPLRELPSVEGIATRTSAEAIKNPTLAMARKSGQFNPAIHESDFVNVMQRYTGEASRQKFIGPALEGGVDTLNQLRLSGLKNEAEAFKRYLTDVLNIDSERSAAELFSAYKTNQIKPAIDEFVRLVPEADTVGKEIYSATVRAMYNNLVGTNPNTWVKQLLQAPVFGSIELGPTWWATGIRDAAAGGLKIGRERLREAKKILKASLVQDIATMDEQFTNAPKSAIAKGIDFINKPAALLARRTMGAGEDLNRLQTVLGAQNKFDAYWNRAGEQGINSLLSQSALTTAQREMISRAYIAGGVKNAKDLYALLITQRVNFTYSIADKPEILRNTLGKLFPFTTYARNVLARAAEAYTEGQKVQLVKQIAYPLSVLAAFDAFTGKSLPGGFLPVESVMDLVVRGIAPSPLIIAANPLAATTPIPKGLVKVTMDDGVQIDMDKAIENLYKKANVFKPSEESKYKKFFELIKGD